MGVLSFAIFFGGVLTLLVTIGVYFGTTKPETDRQIMALDERATIAEKLVNERDRQIVALGERATIAEKLVDERDRQIDDLRSTIEALSKPRTRKLVNNVRKGDSSQPGPLPKNLPTCDTHDPLCFALP
jgi:hypothetical protein